MSHKFTGLVLALFILGSFTEVPEIQAYPFIEVEGYVGPPPSGVTVIDNGDGTSTLSQIDYRFNVTYAALGAKMDFLTLQFENDVFVLPGTISGLYPSDWSTSIWSIPGPTGSNYLAYLAQFPPKISFLLWDER